jgi:protein SCO1/2
VVRRIVLPLLFALLLAACAAPAAAPSPAPADGSQGTPIDPPVALSDFTLPSSLGRDVSLSELRGKPTLLFFGYTFCPDVCPTTLAEFKRVKDQLGDDGDKVNYVFISVDPERDTPEVLARYVGAFDPAFVGLQGDEATLRRIGKEYGLFYQKSRVEGTSASYLVDHTAASFLIDRDGQLRVVFGYGTPVEGIKAGVERLLAE